MVLHHGLFLLSTGTTILSETLCSQSLLASIPHSLSGSHLAAANYPSLCVLSLLLSMSLCMPVYVEREVIGLAAEGEIGTNLNLSGIILHGLLGGIIVWYALYQFRPRRFVVVVQ